AEMAGQGQPLRDERAVAVEQRRRIIHVVLQHARIGRAEDGQRHLVGDPEQRVLEQFELDRIADHVGTLPQGGVIAAHPGPASKRGLDRTHACGYMSTWSSSGWKPSASPFSKLAGSISFAGSNFSMGGRSTP